MCEVGCKGLTKNVTRVTAWRVVFHIWPQRCLMRSPVQCSRTTLLAHLAQRMSGMAHESPSSQLFSLLYIVTPQRRLSDDPKSFLTQHWQSGIQTLQRKLNQQTDASFSATAHTNCTGSAQLDLIGGAEKGIMSTIWLHSLTDIIPLTTKPHLMTFEILSTWSVVSALYVFIFQPITQFRCWFTNSQWRWFCIHIGLLINVNQPLYWAWTCTFLSLRLFSSTFCPLVYHLQLNLQSAYVLSIVSRNYLTIFLPLRITSFISVWFESCDWFVMINL